MVIDKVLAPALFFLPQSRYSGVDKSLDGVIQPELFR